MSDGVGVKDGSVIEGFRLCATCFEPYEWRLQGAASRQSCRCARKVTTGSRWPGYDYNEHLHLCECCSAEPLESGSKWSIWFCSECQGRVDGFNSQLGFYAMPIGRHSLMGDL